MYSHDQYEDYERSPEPDKEDIMIAPYEMTPFGQDESLAISEIWADLEWAERARAIGPELAFTLNLLDQVRDTSEWWMRQVYTPERIRAILGNEPS